MEDPKPKLTHVFKETRVTKETFEALTDLQYMLQKELGRTVRPAEARRVALMIGLGLELPEQYKGIKINNNINPNKK